MMDVSPKGFIHIPLLVLAFGLLFASAVIPVKRTYNDGKNAVAGVFLAKGGDDSSSGSSSGGGGDSSGGSSGGGSSSGSSGSSSSGSSGSSGGSSGSSGSGSSGTSGGSSTTGSTKVVTPTPAPVFKKVEVETKTVNENERVETKATADNIKSEIRQGNLRIKFEIKDGKVEIETKVKLGENEIELENETENEAVNEVETELEKDDVKVATAPGQIALVNKRVGALTNFPLSVDPTTRQLTVTTPAGTKTVAVLPQKAVDNLLASHVMDDVVNEKVENSLASIPEMIKMEVENGVLGFKIVGTKTHKLLGLIPIKTGVDAFVSAENGQVMETNESLLGRILDRLAP